MPVIFNSNAGEKRRGPLVPPVGQADIERALQEAGVIGRIIPTSSEEQARQEIAKEVKAGASLIVAAGGDGTVDVVASEVLGRGVALGILPLGSVMNVARMLGVPHELPGAAQVIAARREALIDVAYANGRMFLETATVGISAAVFRHVQEWENGDRRSIYRAIREAFLYNPVSMELTFDDGERTTTRALMVTISNAPYVGVAMTVAPDARLDDGQFDVVVWEQFSKAELFRHFATIAWGRRSYSPHVSRFRSATVTVVGKSPLPTRADAQDLGTTPIECTMRSRVLKVLVGPDYADGRVRVPAASDK